MAALLNSPNTNNVAFFILYEKPITEKEKKCQSFQQKQNQYTKETKQ